MSNVQTTFLQTITPSFSGHQTFPFRYTWLKKGVDAVSDPTVFSSEDASVTLGVGKNMVASIRHWCSVALLIKKADDPQHRGFTPTKLGKDIFGKDGFDPYLDDPATLWLIHYQIATNTNQATAWYWAFNVLRGNQFTPQVFKRDVYKWAQHQKPNMRSVSPNTLQRDINCFIRTYCQSRGSSNNALTEESFDCPLVELNLIAELPDSNAYEFQRGAKETLPLEIVAWSLNTFWKSRHDSQEQSLTFSNLMYDPLSPGRVFRLDEDTMTTYLENLEQLTEGALSYDETSGLKQVYRHRYFDQMELLERYYG